MKRIPPGKDTETAILTRMELSRVALLASNRTAASVPAVRGQSRSQAASLMASLAEAPRVRLLLALCLGVIVFGPQRTIRIVGRAGVTAWLGAAARRAIARSG